jgi:hypothetical protein
MRDAANKKTESPNRPSVLTAVPAGDEQRGGKQPGDERSAGPLISAPAPGLAFASTQSPATEHSAIEAFRGLVQGPPAQDRTVGGQRMAQLLPQLTLMTRAELLAIASDQALMKKTTAYVGRSQLIRLLAALGMYATTTGADGAEVAWHMTGPEVDTFIEAAMNRFPHLQPYIAAANKDGRRATGNLVVVDDFYWKELYKQHLPSEPIGSDDELRTNAFIVVRDDDVIVLKNDRGPRSTAIHETMHLYSNDNVFQSFGRSFDEGVTEFFTRLLADRDGNPASLGGKARDHYETNWRFVDLIMPLLGNTRNEQEIGLAEMYFAGKTNLLYAGFTEKARRDASMSPENIDAAWLRLISAIRDSKWMDAILLVVPLVRVMTPHL